MLITGNAADVASAYVKARSEMETLVAKEGKGVYGKYMELATILEMVMPILTKNGLIVTQEPTSNEDGVGVSTTILHTSGATMEFVPLFIPLTKREPHATGSALSYAKRYALAAIFGLAGDDDDGQAAQDSFKPKTAKPAPVASYQDDELWDKPATHSKQPDTVSVDQLERLTKLVTDYYGSEAEEQQVKLSEAVSKGSVRQFKDLTAKEAQVLIGGIEKKIQQVQGQKNGVAA